MHFETESKINAKATNSNLLLVDANLEHQIHLTLVSRGSFSEFFHSIRLSAALIAARKCARVTGPPFKNF